MPFIGPNAAPTFAIGPLVELIISSVPLLLDALKSARLRLPASRDDTPYEVLNCRVQLTIADARGVSATYLKSERVRMLRPGVAHLSEFAWGDGISSYITARAMGA